MRQCHQLLFWWIHQLNNTSHRNTTLTLSQRRDNDATSGLLDTVVDAKGESGTQRLQSQHFLFSLSKTHSLRRQHNCFSLRFAPSLMTFNLLPSSIETNDKIESVTNPASVIQQQRSPRRSTRIGKAPDRLRYDGQQGRCYLFTMDNIIFDWLLTEATEDNSCI